MRVRASVRAYAHAHGALMKYIDVLIILALFVLQDFGSIFSTLLPGANAKLTPPEGQSILEGLEVKVAFGNVWKESLTELSGGQRYYKVDLSLYDTVKLRI